MSASKLDLTMVRGTTFGPVVITCWEDAQKTQRLNLTGWGVEAQARKKPGPASPLVLDFGPVISAAAMGEITLPELPPEATLEEALGAFGWDLVLIRPTGERLGPLLQGKLSVMDIHTQPED